MVLPAPVVPGIVAAGAPNFCGLRNGNDDLKPRKSISGFSSADHLKTMAEAVSTWAERITSWAGR